MYLQKAFQLLFFVLVILGVAGFISRDAVPAAGLYSYRVTVYEPAMHFLHPSGSSRDAYVKALMNSRWQELTSEIQRGSLLLTSAKLRPAFTRNEKLCRERSEKLLSSKQWRRSQDLAAFCMMLPKAYKRLWQEAWVVGEQGSIAFDILKEQESATRDLLSVRADAADVAQVARDRTDFLAGLEERLNECLVEADKARLEVLTIRPATGKETYSILEMDTDILTGLSAGTRKSIGIGSYREGWWQSSELCASSHAILVGVAAVKNWQVSIKEPLRIAGFGQVK